MPKNKDLTILLTLKGRHLHTLRWLWHANRVHLPYHVVIADGEVHPAIDRLLSNEATFRNLSFEYNRYADNTYSDYYRKLTDSLGRIESKYVMMSDNDDFLIITGIQKSIDFLEKSSEYVCAGGRVIEFKTESQANVLGKVVGKILPVQHNYNHKGKDISSLSMTERILSEIREYQFIYYHIYKKESLSTIFQELEEHNFSDLNIAEQFCALRSITLGGIATLAELVCYARQKDTTQGFSNWNDWVNHFLHSNLSQDYRMLASSIARIAYEDAEMDRLTFGEKILQGYGNTIRIMLAYALLRNRFPTLFRIKRILIALKDRIHLPIELRNMRGKRKMWNALSKKCNDAAMLKSYRKEMDHIEHTLESSDFERFLREVAPDLITERVPQS